MLGPISPKLLLRLHRQLLSRSGFTAIEDRRLSHVYSGLDFTAQALRHNLQHPTEELSTSFREAYGGTLKPHHSFVIKPIFSAAMSATPYRKDFYKKLGDDDAKVVSSMEKEVAALEKVVSILKTFTTSKEAQWK